MIFSTSPGGTPSKDCVVVFQISSAICDLVVYDLQGLPRIETRLAMDLVDEELEQILLDRVRRRYGRPQLMRDARR